MQQQQNENEDLCINQCGFFGSSASGGMCSVCWKKTLSNRQAETQNLSAAVAAPVTPAPVQEQEQVDNASSVDDSQAKATTELPKEAEAPKPAEKPVQKNKKRCWECKKKVGYTGIECRCGYIFCGSHRYADQHSCTFDFKASDRAILAKQNPGGGEFVKVDKL